MYKPNDRCHVRLPPRYIGLAISAITGLASSVLMTFVGLAVNYGFHPDFLLLWAKAAALAYCVGVPLITLLVPPVQRFVFRLAAIG